MDTQALLTDLTPEQQEAVRHVDGPLLIIAGAGSGKTRVITRRVAYLMSQNVPPWSILAITFTNKAAGEMKERVGKILGRPLRDFGRLEQPWPMVCTFHSLCMRILRHFAPALGLNPNFSIYDSADQTRVMKEAIKLLEMSSTNFPPSTVHGTISNAKNQLISAEQYTANARDFYTKQIARIYSKYQKLLEQNNALDFDDLLLKTAQALRDKPEVLAGLQDRFKYILIDEYQDTNHAQYIIAHAMAQKNRNICVVGDPDQSIYRWRGADIKNILEFERDYPDAKVVKLERNYRSTKTILQAASTLIANNKRRKKKDLWTENAQGEKAEVYLCQDEHDEAEIVAKRLSEMHEKENVAWNRMAIFYRINALTRVMEDALRKKNIPYVMARGVEFYNRKVVKDVLAYLRVIANPDDEVSLTRVMNTPPRGIGDGSVKLMKEHALIRGISLWGAMKEAATVEGLSTRAIKATGLFVDLVESWRKAAPISSSPTPGTPGKDEGGGLVFSSIVPEKGPVTRLMEDVVKRSGMEAALKKDEGSEEGDDPLANVNELISSAAEYEAENPQASLNDYLSMISLVSDIDHMKGNGGAVTMMTLHAAKGLEFPVVAIIGLEEGILPHSRSRDSEEEREEERRLLFVGITRAQDHLMLSKAAYRTIRGLRERTITSPFLNELPPETITITDRAGFSPATTREEYRERLMEESEQLAGSFHQGQMVRHPAFGVGRIAEISNMGQQTRAVVEFRTVGRKTLILQYARIEPVG